MLNDHSPALAPIMCASCSMRATRSYAPNPRDFPECAGSCTRHFTARDETCVYCATDHVFLCLPCAMTYVRTLGVDCLDRLTVFGAEPLDMCNRADWLTAVVRMWEPASPVASVIESRYRAGMLSACRELLARIEGN